MQKSQCQEKLCLYETNDSVTSISTMDFVPQPLDEKSHFIRNRIFVGNFSDTATQKDINVAFRPFGKIIETNIIDSPNSTGRYGFVTFQSIEAADAVLSLYSRGREFRVQGDIVTINHALFKPKKRINVKESVTPTNSKSVMMLGGQKVVAEYANGMAYFQPVKEKNAIGGQVSTVIQKNINAGLGFPSFHLTNQIRFSANSYSPPMFRFSAVMPPTNMCGLPPPTVRPNFVPTQMPPCYPLLRPCYGSLPIIR